MFESNLQKNSHLKSSKFFSLFIITTHKLKYYSHNSNNIILCVKLCERTKKQTFYS